MNSHASHLESSRNPAHRVRLALLPAISLACLVASAFHWGLTLSVAGAVLEEPPIFPAAVVEGLIGIAFALSFAASVAGRAWARPAVLAGYVLGITGFLIGITAVARDADLQTPFNVAVHAAVFPLLLVGFALELEAGRAGGGEDAEV